MLTAHSLTTAGLKSVCTGRRGAGGDSSSDVDQAPGWDGQVTDTTRFTTAENNRAATTTHNIRHNSSPNHDECNYISTRGASKATSTEYVALAGMPWPTVEKGKLIADTVAVNNKPNTAEHIAEASLPLRSCGGEDWPSTPDSKLLHSELEDEEEETGYFTEGQDTAAGDDNSNGASSRNRSVPGAAYGPTCTLQAGRHEGGLTGSAPGTNDTISELSCSGIFTIPSAVGDDQGNEDPDSDESTHDSSSESPNQTRVASPRDDDDIGASHVEHLMQERRRWKLRAFESEHELAAVRSLHARFEKRDGARAMGPQSPEATMFQASGSFSEPMVSETSSVESGFELDHRWQTASGSDGASSASSRFTAGGPSVARGGRQHGFLDTASDAQFSGGVSATANDLQASGAQRDAPDLESYRQNRLADDDDSCDGRGKDGVTEKQIEGAGDGDHRGEQGTDAARTNRLLREEIAELKENLRRAELRHAAAEATAASVLQRARAAELARDVKEIQVREYLRTLEAQNGWGGADLPRTFFSSQSVGL